MSTSSIPLYLARAVLVATILMFAALEVGAAAPEASPRAGEDASFVRPSPGFSTRSAPEHTRYTTTRGARGQQEITANFLSFSGDPLSIHFALAPTASRDSIREFGISIEELDALMDLCRAKKGCDQAEYDRHTTRYYQTQGMRLSQVQGQTPRLHVDIVKAVHRNRARVKPVAIALRRLAQEQNRDDEWMIDAAIALVQSGLVYRQPDTWEGGRKILGFYPPPRALEQGYGDCDTKSALLAAILQNLTRDELVGVHVPKHYLLGMSRVPRAGQTFIQYRGKPFVLVEAAGPARRPPGAVSQTTETALARMDGIRVDPMF